MIFACDSALPPSAASIISAKADGVRLWAGYYPGPGIWQDPRHPWTHNDFIRIQESGLATLAFCSGWTDPATIKATSASWGIPFCVDVENGIRDDGSWLQGWLDAAEVCGLYGHGPVHRGRRAPFHVVTYFPGSNPNLTWPTRAWWPAVWGAYVPKPGTPCAWQYQRSTQAYGATIDRSWYDNEFAARFSLGSGSGGTDLTPDESSTLLRDDTILSGARLNTKALDQRGLDIEAKIDALPNKITASTGGLTDADRQLLQGIDGKLNRLIAELHTP